MEKVIIKLTISIDEELDSAIYGKFYSHTRDHDGAPFVKLGEKSEWIPVNDWKGHSYIATESTLKRIARHFMEIGKHMKEED